MIGEYIGEMKCVGGNKAMQWKRREWQKEVKSYILVIVNLEGTANFTRKTQISNFVFFLLYIIYEGT